jgi:sulfate adenylyltransferase large subunit
MNAGLLRFTTAGSVDDGKSTLIGRLLYDSKGVYEDQIAAVRKSPVNRAAGPIDFSLLTDGLRAEREQGITIDVAYRYFATPRRRFIIADTPGHEQYTRNMATGASTADLAVILIDARNGVSTQSRRHACIAALLGIRGIVVAVNKMDLIGFSRGVFEEIRDRFSLHLECLGIADARFVPVSALEGDNVVSRSARAPWYEGETLLEALENAPVAGDAVSGPLRFPVQYVLRPDLNFRGYAGRIASGALRPGDRVMALPSGRTTRVRSLPSYDGELSEAFPPMSTIVCLEDELDVSRGDMLVDPRNPPSVGRRFEAMLVWMREKPLEAGQRYLLKHTTQMVTATVTSLVCRIDVNTLEREDAERLEMNDIGSVAIETSRPIFFDPYSSNRAAGSLILIDPITNATVAAGMIERGPALTAREDAAARTGPRSMDAPLAAAERHARAGHLPAVVWLQGRPDLARLLEARLFALGCQVFATGERTRVSALADVAQVLTAAGLIVITSADSPKPGEQESARMIESGAGLFVYPDGLAASDERAADEILRALQDAGIVSAQGDLGAGEGI